VIVRLFAIAFALLLSAQAALPGGTIRVCRYTGQRVDPCACPGKKPVEETRLLRQDCCELRQSHHAETQGVVPTLAEQAQVHVVELPAVATWQPPDLPEEPGPRTRCGHDPPPRARLFLSLRQLLI
jgi:hypothetical protein